MSDRLSRLVCTLCLALALALAGAACGGEDSEVEPLPPVGIEMGLRAPPLVGRSPDGEPFRFAEHLGESPVLLVFYRGGYCGLCRRRLVDLQQSLDAYEAADVQVVGVTLDAPPEIARTRAALGLEFPVIGVDTAIYAQWELLDSERQLPLPAAVLLDERGVVAFRYVGRNAADRPSDAELLAVVRQARSGLLPRRPDTTQNTRAASEPTAAGR